MELVPQSLDARRNPSLGRAINDWSERIAGRDRRTSFAGEGVPKLPDLSRDSLELGPKATTALQNARVYLLPGTPWPGVAQNGAAWLEPWAKMLERAGVGRAVPIPYEGDSFVAGCLRYVTDPVFNQSQRRILSLIKDDLAKHPLKPSETLFIIGHSNGAKAGVEVANALKAQGLPVEGMVMLGTRLPDLGQFVTAPPRVRTVLEVENDPGEFLTPQPTTDFRTLMLPELRHMDLVLNPPAKLFDQILRAIAQVPIRALERPTP